jgi:hypothetical protein
MVVVQDDFDPIVPLTHSRIGIHSIGRTGTVSASSAAAGFPASAAANPLTYEFWKPTAVPGWWRVDAGAPVTVDYVGIAAHNLATAASTVTVQSSDDNDTWVDVDSHTPTSDAPIMFLFAPTTARYWRVVVTGNTPTVGVIYIGAVLEMQRAAFAGINPIDLTRRTTIRPNVSEGGQWLGRSVIREGSATAVSFRHLTFDWYRTNFDPFVEDARSYPFFFAWRPEGYEHSVGYVWTTSDIAPTTMGIKDYLRVSLDMEGLSLE